VAALDVVEVTVVVLIIELICAKPTVILAVTAVNSKRYFIVTVEA
jgi:hypothetical protein